MPRIDLELPFDIDERVYPIYQTRPDARLEIPCRFCGGERDIEGRDGSKAPCPRCDRRGMETVENQWVWEVDGLGESVLRLDHYKLDRSGGGEIVLEAMIYDVWAEEDWGGDWTSIDDIFTTQREAQTECDRRNGMH